MGMTFKAARVSESELRDVDLLPERLRYGAPGAIHLDKAWDGLLWLLSEERRERPYMLPDPSLPETWAILPPDRVEAGGVFIGVLRPERVRRVAETLAALDEAALRAHFDPDAMRREDVYPSIWDEGASVLTEYLAPHFEVLRTFYSEAAAAGDAVISTID